MAVEKKDAWSSMLPLQVLQDLQHCVSQRMQRSSLLRSQEHVDAKAVFDALKAQDEVAEEIVEEFGKYLGHALG